MRDEAVPCSLTRTRKLSWPQDCEGACFLRGTIALSHCKGPQKSDKFYKGQVGFIKARGSHTGQEGFTNFKQNGRKGMGGCMSHVRDIHLEARAISLLYVVCVHSLRTATWTGLVTKLPIGSLLTD